jgi:phosphatidate cytidylyltransferase
MKRVLTALLLIPLVTAVTFYAPPLVVWVVLALVALLCLREFFLLAVKFGCRPFSVAGCGAGAVLIVARDIHEGAFLVGFSILLLLLALTRPLEESLGGVASTLFGVIYIGGAFSLGRELHVASPHWLFYVLVLNWVGDSAAYFVGRSWGRRPLAPAISPNKTWEGTIASAVVAVAVGVGYLAYFQPAAVSLLTAGLLSLWVNTAAQLGDLAESALKRGAHVKDSGELLPGHGGMLDRVDGVLFALPACYAVVAWLV